MTPMLNWFVKKGAPGWLALVITIGLVVVLLLLLVCMVGSSLQGLFDGISAYDQRFAEIERALGGVLNDLGVNPEDLAKIPELTQPAKILHKALIDDYKGSRTYMGGFIAALEEFPDVEIVPTTFWSFSTGGTIDGKAYPQMKQDILERLAKAMPLDGVALCLHGAGVTEDVDDAETDLTAAIRKQLGPGV